MNGSSRIEIDNEDLLACRSKLASAMKEFHTAIDDLKDLLDAVQQGEGQLAERMAHGEKVLDVVELMDPAAYRRRMDTAEDRVRKARHNVRRTMFVLAETEGSSRAEIARIWQVSRQLISRMMREKD